MRLPEFIVIGSPKAGTTTLFEYLRRHPCIFMAEPKEPEFFAVDDKWARGVEWYGDLFSDAPADAVVGEASTKYSCFPEFPDAAERVAATVPDVKLVYLVRDPVRRAFSHWQQRIKTRQNTGVELFPTYGETFEEAIESADYFLQASDYALQLSRYLQFFPRARILIGVFEEFVGAPAAFLGELAEFLGVDASGFCAQDEIVANDADSHFADHVRKRIVTRLQRVPLSGAFRAALPSGLKNAFLDAVGRSRVGDLVEAELRPPAMLAETEVRLRGFFESRVKEFEAILGREVGYWGTRNAASQDRSEAVRM